MSAEVTWMSGRAINWIDNPPKPTHMTRLSKNTIFGGPVHGSLRTMACMARLDSLSIGKFGTGVSFIQSCYNVGVPASAGTHDKDAVLDVWIPGVNPWLQQRFFRANGFPGWYRHCPEFCGNEHYHGLVLPADTWHFRTPVGIFVPGQLTDVHNHAFGLSGEHDRGSDRSWWPKSLKATAFDLSKFVEHRRAEQRADRKKHRH